MNLACFAMIKWLCWRSCLFRSSSDMRRTFFSCERFKFHYELQNLFTIHSSAGSFIIESSVTYQSGGIPVTKKKLSYCNIFLKTVQTIASKHSFHERKLSQCLLWKHLETKIKVGKPITEKLNACRCSIYWKPVLIFGQFIPTYRKAQRSLFYP